MKKIFICFLVSAFALHTSTVRAQQSEQEYSIGIGLEAGIVKGSLKQVYTTSAGITATGAYHVGPGYLTATSGIVALLPQKNNYFDYKTGFLVPFKLGYKLIIQDYFFVMGEAGYSTLTSFYDDGYGISSFKHNGFTYAPSAGIQFGSLELGVRYEVNAFSGATLKTPTARLAYNF